MTILAQVFTVLAVSLFLHHIQRAFGDRVYHIVSAAILVVAIAVLVVSA